MRIESSMHYDGTHEMIRRYRTSLEIAAKRMSGPAYQQVEAQILREIEVLEDALEAYRKENYQSIDTRRWFSFAVTSPGQWRDSRPLLSQIVMVLRPLTQSGLSLSQ